MLKKKTLTPLNLGKKKFLPKPDHPYPHPPVPH